MPIIASDANKRAGKTTTVKVVLGDNLDDPSPDDIIEFSYNRDKYTPKIEREMRDLMMASYPGGSLAIWLSAVGRSWNVVDYEQTEENLKLPKQKRKTVPIPLTQENLETFCSIEVLAKIANAIAEQQNPNQNSSVNTKNSF